MIIVVNIVRIHIYIQKFVLYLNYKNLDIIYMKEVD